MLRSFKVNTFLRFLFQPYIERLKLGEGGLIGLNIALFLFSYSTVQPIIVETLLSFGVITSLYAYNDFIDRYKDKSNPKKNQYFVHLIISHETAFISLNVFVSTVCLLISILILSPEKSALLALLYAVNYVYSNRLKSTPLLDIIVVGLWGGLFVALAKAASLQMILYACLMTCIAHVFQILDDKITDAANQVNTTAVVMPKQINWILIILCIAFAVVVCYQINFWWALGSFAPILVYILSCRVHFSWYIARIYFVLVWIKLLLINYGGIQLFTAS